MSAAVLALAAWAALKQMHLSSFVGIIEIGLEHAPFVVWVYFIPYLNMQKTS
jgi:hypothetical protein